MEGYKTVSRLLDVVEQDILPITRKEVKKGHNIFGGAVLAGEDLSLVTAGTNMRGEDPTLHGEMVTIGQFFRMKDRPSPEETIFLSTHEPCSMCLSALAWSGFKKIFFLFGYEETRDDFRMGDDLRILEEIFSTTTPSRKNPFFELIPVRSMLRDITKREALSSRIKMIKGEYIRLTDEVFQIQGKSAGGGIE
ncbi:MAG TPA: nucleoside deaminase [Synergistetes bacterium]|nr:nucleoside deaminase [Synergistota bacterium]